MLIATSEELCKYVIPGEFKSKARIAKEAPEEVKQEAREINKIAVQLEGEEHYIIEE